MTCQLEPLSLTIEFLAPRQSWFTIRFRASAFGRLAISSDGVSKETVGPGTESTIPLVCFFSGLRFLKKLKLPKGLLSLGGGLMSNGMPPQQRRELEGQASTIAASGHLNALKMRTRMPALTKLVVADAEASR